LQAGFELSRLDREEENGLLRMASLLSPDVLMAYIWKIQRRKQLEQARAGDW
jgi:hypothetical protein